MSIFYHLAWQSYCSNPPNPANKKWSSDHWQNAKQGSNSVPCGVKKEMVKCRPVVFSGLFPQGLHHMAVEKKASKGVKRKGGRAVQWSCENKMSRVKPPKLKGNVKCTTHSGLVYLKSQAVLINVFIITSGSLNNVMCFFFLLSFFLPFSFL